jgi:hypothetical protein
MRLKNLFKKKHCHDTGTNAGIMSLIGTKPRLSEAKTTGDVTSYSNICCESGKIGECKTRGVSLEAF